MHIDFKGKIYFFLYWLRALLIKDTWQHISRCDVLLVRHDNNCGYRYDGKAYAQLIDSFGELCIKHNLTVNSVAKPYSRFVGERAQFSPVSFNRSLMCISIIGTIIAMINGYDLGNRWKQSHRIDLWCQILEAARPKCVIGIQPSEYLCRAGKLQKIPVYDLQHGIITNESPYYGEAYRLGTPPENLPVGFLCWDDQGAEPISKWASNNGIRILKVGNPWFLRFVKIQPDDLLVNTSLAGNIISDDRPCILVSLQDRITEIYPDQVCNGVMADALEKVISDTSELYTWIIRLHPVQLNGIEKKAILDYLTTTFGSERTRIWLMASWTPLPVILKQADLHITFSSAVVVEAAWMGVRTGLLDTQIGKEGISKEWYSYERSLGMAEVLSPNPEIIKQWIVDTLAKGGGQSTLEDFSQNMDAFIDEIAKETS